ncbi:MAG: hypothetical protein ACE5FH_12995 [Candidatus Zixiibacteriota bacterium]
MNRAIQKIIQTGRLAVVMLALLALLVSGASSAKRLFYNNQAGTADDTKQLDSPGLTPLPCPEELPENMEPSSQPNGEPSALLLSAAVLSPDNSESRIPACLASISSEHRCQVGSDSSSSFRSTTGRVSSILALRATLVGARPSGTS